MKLLKLWLCVVTAVSMACSVPVTSLAAEHQASAEELQTVQESGKISFAWERGDASWKLLYLKPGSTDWVYARKWVMIGDSFYYFDEDGNMQEGWFQTANGAWFFAQTDSLNRKNPDAGKILTGWASIQNMRGEYHNFYFGVNEKGEPTGMYAGSDDLYKTYTIDGNSFSFDGDGHCGTNLSQYGIVPTQYNRVRTGIL